MKKIKVEDNTNDNGIFQIIGILLIGFAVVDFAMSWMGTNLTAFLGPLSQFTPLAAGLTGAMFLNLGIKVNKSSLISSDILQGILIKQRRYNGSN